MSEIIDHFKLWEDDMHGVATTELPEDNLEQYLTKAIDPLIGAQMIQQYVETQSPDAQEELIRKYLDILNFHFMGTYINCPTQVTVEGLFDMPDLNQATDMADVLIELEDKGSARVGGKMAYFEKHYYTNSETNVRRPVVSLRMHSGAFRREDGDSGQIVGISNYVTIPVTAISDYSIKERN